MDRLCLVVKLFLARLWPPGLPSELPFYMTIIREGKLDQDVFLMEPQLFPGPQACPHVSPVQI